MVKNAELNEVVKGLQTQMESLQAQRVEILRVLAEQSENMKALRQQSDDNMMFVRSLVQQVHNLQVLSPPKKDVAPPTLTTGLLHLCDSKVLLCSESIPTGESRSKSDLSDLKMATVDLVGEDKHTSDSVGNKEEVAKPVGDEQVSMKPSGEVATEVFGEVDETGEIGKPVDQPIAKTEQLVVITAQSQVSNGVKNVRIADELENWIHQTDEVSSAARKFFTALSKRKTTWLTFVKDRGKPMTVSRRWWNLAR